MNRNRLIAIGLIAIVLAMGVTYVTFSTVSKKIASSQQPMSDVVVTTSNLSVGVRIQPADVKLAKVPTAQLPDGYFSVPTDVVGRGVIVPMFKNEMVISAKLAGERAGSGLPSLIPSKMRAVSVRVNDVISVAGFVSPGTRVDVLLTGNPTNAGNNNGDVMTTTVLENVEVLAAGQQMQQGTGEGKTKPTTVAVITLLVSPEDAQKLTLASSEGKIQLSLRNPLDLDTPNPNAVRNASLYHIPITPATAAKRAVAKKILEQPQQAAYVVEMIRGDKRDKATF